MFKKYVGRHFAKKFDYVNENIFTESRRSERVESAEALKDSSDFTNSSDLKNYKMDCHEVVPTSRNDETMAQIPRKILQDFAMIF